MLVATILAKDEEDILAANIDHLLEQGVDKIIATDNGSTDLTQEILQSYKEVDVIIENDTSYAQSKWVTHMARLACDKGADWVINIDADEFWDNLNTLGDQSMDTGVVVSQSWFNYYPATFEEKEFKRVDYNSYLTGGGSKFYCDSMKIDFSYYDELGVIENRSDLFSTDRKIAHRASDKIVVGNGNHSVCGYEGDVKVGKIDIHHYSLRSYERFKKRVTTRGEALKKKRYGGASYHYIDLYAMLINDEECLKKYYKKLMFLNLSFM